MVREKIRKAMVRAIADFELIKPGDRVLLCVSGGKDSSVMALLFKDIRDRAPFPFTFQAVLLDQKQPGFDARSFEAFFAEEKIPLEVIEEDTYSIVTEVGQPKKSPCGLCSRLRRGILYNYAHAHQFHSMALGHHLDDLNETILMNLFFNGRYASMPAKLRSDDGRNVVIRPLVYVKEEWILELQRELGFPVIPCQLCGSMGGQKRQEMKQLLKELTCKYPHIPESLHAAQKNIRPSQLLDRDLFDFTLS